MGRWGSCIDTVLGLDLLPVFTYLWGSTKGYIVRVYTKGVHRGALICATPFVGIYGILLGYKQRYGGSKGAGRAREEARVRRARYPPAIFASAGVFVREHISDPIGRPASRLRDQPGFYGSHAVYTG